MLKHRKFVVNHFLENTYVVFDEPSREGMIIDPGLPKINEMDDFISQSQIKITHIVCTHCHPDHMAGVTHYQKAYKAPFLIHQNEIPVLESYPQWAPMLGFEKTAAPKPDHFLKEGEILKVGAHDVQIMHTPGHTPGGMCLHCAASKMVLTGDTLFQGSIGRTDLPGGNTEQLLTSIENHLLSLPEDTVCLPGHGEDTTVGHEKRHNPFLS